MKRCFCQQALLTLVCCTLFAAAGAEECRTVWHGERSPEEAKISISVDDCYNTDHVLAVIELCEQYDVPMTFFPVGSGLKCADAALWQRALDAGCEIGNHTWNHKDLTGQNERGIRFELLRTQQKLDELLGYHYAMQVLRPPYGETNARVRETAGSIGYRLVANWDVSQTDPYKAIEEVQNGSILLYHTNEKDYECLKILVPMLKEAGYELVTVSDLLGLEPPVIEKPAASTEAAN